MGKKYSQPALPGMPRPRDLMTPEARYPRGYTPDRQRAISEGLKDTVVDAQIDSSGPKNVPTHLSHFRALTVDAIANSKIEPESLSGLRSIIFHNARIPGSRGSETAGQYNKAGRSIDMLGDMTGKDRNISGYVLRHELGHHVTIPLMDDVEPGEKKNGIVEGLADEFASRTTNKIHKNAPTLDIVHDSYPRKAMRGIVHGNDDKDWGEGYFAGRGDGRKEEFINSVHPDMMSRAFAINSGRGVPLEQGELPFFGEKDKNDVVFSSEKGPFE